MTNLNEFRPGFISKLSPACPEETALNIIKGGAQRWNTVSYPKVDASIFPNLYQIFPETIAALVRSIWS